MKKFAFSLLLLMTCFTVLPTESVLAQSPPESQACLDAKRQLNNLIALIEAARNKYCHHATIVDYFENILETQNLTEEQETQIVDIITQSEDAMAQYEQMIQNFSQQAMLLLMQMVGLECDIDLVAETMRIQAAGNTGGC